MSWSAHWGRRGRRTGADHGRPQVQPFDFMHHTDPQQVLGFIQGEHPQTIALILSYLEAPQAAMILSGLPAIMQAEVAKRIARMDRITRSASEVEQVLERKLSTVMGQDFTMAWRHRRGGRYREQRRPDHRRNIMGIRRRTIPSWRREIKKRLFVFEDIIRLDDRSLQRCARST